ncbi:MAG: hypothetical protein ACI9R3_004008 [Verrucomicrobiales bacterium]|jgi:hypothetical protein
MTGAANSQNQNSHEARLALHYFAADSDTFWHWDEHFESIVWITGTTIAFYQEVVAILRALAPEGLPAFDAIALFAAACRDGWSDDANLAQQWNDWADNRPLEIDKIGLRQALLELHQITRRYSKSAEEKGALAAIVFENCRRVVPSVDAAHIVAHLEKRSLAEIGKRQASLTRLSDALQDLATGISAIDADDIGKRMETGLAGQIFAAAIADIPEATRARFLLRELHEEEEEGELGGIASIALNLMAAVHIPRAIDEPESLPLGGYSDISNRGAPDRLLLTELAQDDDVLATRINLNEALYLHREAPPRTPLRQRDIIIDTGIRMWGVPRVFATALGLAFSATANERQSLRVFRPSATNERAEPVNLFSKEGLTAHLSELATSVHPGLAVRSGIEERDCGRDGDLIVITHPDAFEDVSFHEMLKSIVKDPIYVALVDGLGNYSLWQWSPRGKKRLQHARCQLDGILTPGSHTLASIINPDIDTSLPLALRMREFPLLAAQTLHAEQATYHPEIGLASWFRDGRVIVWEHHQHGGRMLQNPGCIAHVLWIWLEPKRREILLVRAEGSDLPPVLARISLDGKETRSMSLDIPPTDAHLACSFHPSGHLLCALSGREIIAYSLASGERVSSLVPEETGRLFGRYFQQVSNQWRILLLRESTLSQEAVPTDTLPKSKILRCFDRDGHEGIHVILENGSIFRLKPEASLVHKMPSGVRQVRTISRDGHRILYVNQEDNLLLLDLNLGRFETIPPRARSSVQLVEKGVARIHKRTPTLRKNFRSIGFVSDSGRGTPCLFLITLNNQIMLVQHAPEQGMIHLRHTHSGPDGLQKIALTPLKSPFGENHSLSVAETADGTRFYLDGRGYLHIVPSDPTLPQVAIVLKDGMLSGWFSDGAWFGDRYFIGDHSPIDSASAFDRLNHCLRNLQPLDIESSWKSG